MHEVLTSNNIAAINAERHPGHMRGHHEQHVLTEYGCTPCVDATLCMCMVRTLRNVWRATTQTAACSLEKCTLYIRDSRCRWQWVQHLEQWHHGWRLRKAILRHFHLLMFSERVFNRRRGWVRDCASCASNCAYGISWHHVREGPRLKPSQGGLWS